MLNLLEMPLVLAALALVGGYVLAKLGAMLGQRERAQSKTDPDRDRQFRAVEAELRVARKQQEQFQAELAALKVERGKLRAELTESQEQLQTTSAKVDDFRDQLRDECEKTQRLRTELSDRAEQGIRDQVQIRDMETELSLAQAGSAVDTDEMSQLVQEREELTERLRQLQRQQEALEQAQASGSHPRRRATDIALDC